MQLTWTVFINCGFFFATTMMSSGGDVQKSLDSITEKLWPTLKVNWTVWPVLTAFNLSVVPLPYRILFINFCSLFWSAFLSNMANTGSGGAAGALPIETVGGIKAAASSSPAQLK